MSDSITKLLDELCESGKYSDFTIKCRDKEIPIHRAIVCAQSAPLAAACWGDFKAVGESNRPARLIYKRPTGCSTMIRFLYCHDYHKARFYPGAFSTKDDLLAHASVYAIANQFSINPLRNAAENKFRSQIETSWKSDFFTQVVTALWDHNEYRGLHVIIEDVVAGHMEHFLNTKPEFLTAGMTKGRLSLEMLRKLIQRVETASEVRYKPPYGRDGF
ncbi:BTB/POZ domain protein [Penicillium capsulatum]|uniref:BTB/POZ domain protein n=1 Tax=Penicillium capsulatum TaxID=69766 RepID=A0A9W9LM17_9EURO|nr:BTB/POZ domain protein [Penicillium capsulatum]KAJ6117246.1 BTB/POZ domain protein [Penicillium capsulatum]